MTPITLDHVRAALTLSQFDAVAAQLRMAPQPRSARLGQRPPGSPRQASVLVLLFPADAGLSFVLTRRTENPHDVHSGQISLPGGAQEPGESPVQTALRETREELGFSGPVDVVGRLTSLYIPPSDFEVHPVVAHSGQHPVWQRDALEVAEVLECPLGWLLDADRKVVEDWELSGHTVRVPWYNVRGHRVWGATAIILSELEQRLRSVLNGSWSDPRPIP
jgi:8-oxo-dGTP pyrophosphatase MutT (NUDIX family)